MDSLEARKRFRHNADRFGILYGLSLAIGGLAWLVAVTDVSMALQNSVTFLFLFLLLLAFYRLPFFMVAEFQRGQNANVLGSLEGVVGFSALLIIGPTALWPWILANIVNFGLQTRSLTTSDDRWDWSSRQLQNSPPCRRSLHNTFRPCSLPAGLPCGQ